MRVLTVGSMYPPHHLGGYELMWRSSVRQLREAGHEVRVLASDYRAPYLDPGTSEDLDVHRDLRWYWHDHRWPRMGPRARLSLERHNDAVLRRHLAELRPDVVSWWAMGGMSLSLIERVRRVGVAAAAVVVDDWLTYAPKVDKWIRVFARRPRMAAAAERLTGLPATIDLAGACLYLFASETIRSRASELAGFDPPRARVAHPGIDLGLFRPPDIPARSWRWRLLYCGRIDPRKGIDTAIRALRHLPDGATLDVVGGGDEEHLGELHELTAREGLTGRVTFARRPRHELPATYAEADVALFPVRWIEPFGLVPLEAMACGTPVAATGLGGSGEYLRNAENCLLFEGGAEELAKAIERLAGDEDLRERLRANGLRTAARFDERSFNRAVEQALLDAAGRIEEGSSVV